MLASNENVQWWSSHVTALGDELSVAIPCDRTRHLLGKQAQRYAATAGCAHCITPAVVERMETRWDPFL
jgi:hypothetical protein